MTPNNEIEDSQGRGASSLPQNFEDHNVVSRARVPGSADHTSSPSIGANDKQHLAASQKLSNPLAGLDRTKLAKMGSDYAQGAGLTSDEDIRSFRLGAMVAGAPDDYDTVPGLGAHEKEAFRRETMNKWSNPQMLYWVIVNCSLCAAVQGMDETVVNGAQSFYKHEFGIGGDSSRDTWLLGLTNSAPYLCCSLIGCWLTDPLNRWLGRRGTVFWSCVISAVACFAQAFANSWWSMFITRFALGFGIGPKSATAPIFAAECSPPRLRGALVMQWQVWTAFGIMAGYVADFAFYFVPVHGIHQGLNWRLMMGSAMIPAILACASIYGCPESPRWYLSKNRHAEAYAALCQLRHERVQAARDLFYMYTLLEAERDAMLIVKSSRLTEMVKVRRNRNAMIASEITMFMQQFCGVNVIAYYSSEIFLNAGFGQVPALVASFGFGVINWLFALPAFYTIDTYGRRNLLLTTFPLMSLFLFLTGFSFWIPESSKAHIGCIALGIYLFGCVYSPGGGPVPFTYSAEAYPLYIRPIGMSLATATTWFFNFLLSITWPSLLAAFKPQGAFGWYAAWNIAGFFLVLFFVPETKEKTLEELDAVFSIGLKDQATYGAAQLKWFLKGGAFRGSEKPVAPWASILKGKTGALNEDETARV